MMFRHSHRSDFLLPAALVLALVPMAWLSGLPVSAQQKPAAATPAVAGDELIGEWWTEKNEGRVRITKEKDGTFRGTTTCCPHEHDENNPSRDMYNPNPKQRERSTVGIIIIWKLKYEDGEYVDGYVYNPRDGKTYRIEMKVIDHETVKIRGYVGISLLGQSQIWKRAHLNKPATPTTAAR